MKLVANVAPPSVDLYKEEPFRRYPKRVADAPGSDTSSGRTLLLTGVHVFPPSVLFTTPLPRPGSPAGAYMSVVRESKTTSPYCPGCAMFVHVSPASMLRNN